MGVNTKHDDNCTGKGRKVINRVKVIPEWQVEKKNINPQKWKLYVDTRREGRE